MKSPEINIAFEEKAVTAIERSQRGIVLLLVRDKIESGMKNPVTILNITDIPYSFEEATIKQIELALMGYVNQPSKVLVYAMGIEEDDDVDEKYNEALKNIENIKFNYMAAPTVDTDGQTAKVSDWIKAQRNKGKSVHAVLPNCESNNEGIINYVTYEHYVTTTYYENHDGEMKEYENTKVYDAAQYCSRIAGLIAGTPLDMSCTYAPLPELTNVGHVESWDIDMDTNRGMLNTFFDGEKVKLGRAINSLTEFDNNKGESFTKIKLVETMDMIQDDIKSTIQDNYLGKYANSYDNKCILIVAISGYFDGLIADNIVSTYSVDIDIEKTKIYLKTHGVIIDDMTDEEIKQQDTGSNVFIAISAKLLDAMEDFYFTISI